LNAPKVIHEQFDDEVVIANLENGRYYSTDQTGAAIWKLVIAGTTQKDIVARIAAEFAGDAREIEQGTTSFLNELCDESLVVAESHQGNGIPSPSISNGSTAAHPFIAPQLHKYTDMEELLLLDPVHEVDEMGWPRKRES